MISNIKKFWLVISCVALVMLWQVVRAGKSSPDRAITFTEFIREIEAGKLKSVSISEGVEVRGEYKDNRPALQTLIPSNYIEIYKILQDHAVEIDIKNGGRGLVSVLINASPFLLLLGFWVFMMRQMRGGLRPPPAT